MKTLRDVLTIGTILPALMMPGFASAAPVFDTDRSAGSRPGTLIVAQGLPVEVPFQQKPPAAPAAPRPEQARPAVPQAPHPQAPTRPQAPPQVAPRVETPFKPPAPVQHATPPAPQKPVVATPFQEKPRPPTPPKPTQEVIPPAKAPKPPHVAAPPPVKAPLPTRPETVPPVKAPKPSKPPSVGVFPPTVPTPTKPVAPVAPIDPPTIGPKAPVPGPATPPRAPGSVFPPTVPPGTGQPPQPGATPRPPRGLDTPATPGIGGPRPIPPQGDARPPMPETPRHGGGGGGGGGVGAVLGGVAAGVAVGVVGGMLLGGDAHGLEDVRRQRRETQQDGTTIYSEPGRVITRDERGLYLRHDETERFRGLDGEVTDERRGDERYQIWRRPDGVRIVTIVDDEGRLLRRIRRWPDGREEILIDNTRRPRPTRWSDEVVVLPPPVTRERWYVETERADEGEVYDALAAPPLSPLPRRYSLDEIRVSRDLRTYMPAVDVDTVTFESGSWTVEPDQIARLGVVARSINKLLASSPDEIFLVEGHTDAVGSDIDNLSLSDRRAASVASILSRDFGVPPENLTTQGYGEQVLKEATSGPSAINRRVTVRRITPLLDTTSGR